VIAPTTRDAQKRACSGDIDAFETKLSRRTACTDLASSAVGGAHGNEMKTDEQIQENQIEISYL
jgi:hypothetical protein